MHANYLFLMDTEDCDMPKDMVPPWESAYLRYTDENNWWTVKGALFRGELYSCIDDIKWSKSNEKYDPLTGAMCVAAIDMGVNGACELSIVRSKEREALESMSRDELLSLITSQVPEVLSGMYKKAHCKLPHDVCDDRMEAYERAKLSKHYEMFMSSYIPPFSVNIRSPYDYRCYDLRDANGTEFDSDKEGVLIVDIHT